ncbi:MAG: nuclear transport factor 2 family protein [Myxococcota bacterium]
MNNSDLLARIQRLEDIESLKQLKARYAAYCDDNYNEDELAPLFTEEAIWDGGAMGRFEGRAAIREFFAASDQVVPFAIHHVTNPILEVDGDHAKGRWYLWQPCTFAEGNQALWMAGTYDDRYRRENGQWLFEQVTITLRMLSPYEAGWAKTPIMEIPS